MNQQESIIDVKIHALTLQQIARSAYILIGSSTPYAMQAVREADLPKPPLGHPTGIRLYDIFRVAKTAQAEQWLGLIGGSLARLENQTEPHSYLSETVDVLKALKKSAGVTDEQIAETGINRYRLSTGLYRGAFPSVQDAEAVCSYLMCFARLATLSAPAKSGYEAKGFQIAPQKLDNMHAASREAFLNWFESVLSSVKDQHLVMAARISGTSPQPGKRPIFH